MAHEIWQSDNFITVREPGWHGLGLVLPDYVSREEAQQLAHPWEPIEEPIYRTRVEMHSHFQEGCEIEGNMQTAYGTKTVWSCGLEDGPNEVYEVIDTHKGLRRSDNGDLLGINGEGYEPTKNDELWDIAEALEGDQGDVMFETAGSLYGGKKVWILIRLRDPILVGDDPNGATVPYFSLQNSHDGSGAFRGQATMTRIVCANTSHIADLDAKARGTQFAFRHTKNVRDRIEDARQALTGWRASIERWKNLTDHMIDLDLTHDRVEDFVERWIPLPPPGTASERVITNVETARAQWWTAYNSETCEGITGTAHGVLQASIEYAEWYRRAHSSESRFKRTYLDRNDVVQSAQKLVLELA